MKKLYAKIILLMADALILPAVLLCRWLAGRMLSTDSICLWMALGGECISCGGTHFVRNLCSGHIGQAFHDNEFFFCVAVVLVIAWVLVHLHLFFHSRVAGKLLRWIFSIPSLIIALTGMVVFLILRNWHLLVLLPQLWHTA